MHADSGTVLILGGSDQDGFHLDRLHRQRGHRVVRAARAASDIDVDVGDPEGVDAVIDRVRPDLVFHLAAASIPSDDPAAGDGTCNVLAAVARHCPGARVLVACSALLFEGDGSPIHERMPLRAGTPDAVDGIRSVHAVREYRARGLRAFVGYLFHRESPLRAPSHLAMRVATAAHEIAAGSRQELEITEPDTVREWAFAGDIAAGMATLIGQDAVGEAVIGTGAGHSIEDWVRRCFERVDLDWRRHVRQAHGFRSASGTFVSDPATIRSLGWQPRVGIDALCDRMMASVLVPGRRGRATSRLPAG